MTKSITSADQQLSELIGRIYQVATDPSGIDGLPKTLASAFNSECEVIFFCRNTSTSESKLPTISGFIAAMDNNDEHSEWYVGGGPRMSWARNGLTS